MRERAGTIGIKRFQRWIGATLALAAIVLALVTRLGPVSGQVAPQPPATAQIPFSHAVHIQEAGIQCLFCHSEALRSPQAGLPSLETCLICHASITVEGEQAQRRVAALRDAYDRGSRVRWPAVYKQPDFVYFSHRPHLARGVSCQTCHGDVQNMDLVEKKVDMTMGFCLDCHRQQVEADARREATAEIAGVRPGGVRAETVIMPRLLDCATCHK